MPSAKDPNVRRPSRYLWTPKGLVDLGEPQYERQWKPTFLGTFEPVSGEGSSSDVVPHRARAALEDARRLGHVDEYLSVSGYPSHDLDPMLG